MYPFEKEQYFVNIHKKPRHWNGKLWENSSKYMAGRLYYRTKVPKPPN